MIGNQVVGNGIVVREYKGKLAEATVLFQQDAASMARGGYFPISQVYQPGSWGCGAFLIALVLFVVLVGVLVFLYMILAKPAGSLVVTYQWRAPDGQTPPPAPVVETVPSQWEQTGGSRTVLVIGLIVVAAIVLIGLNWR